MMRPKRWSTVVLFGLLLTLIVTVPALASGVFPDVPQGHSYEVAIEDLHSKGIIGGYTDGNFGPGDPVTRQQFAKMITGTLDLLVFDSDICPFGDVVGQTGTDPFYPSKYVAVCALYGITNGKDATHFAPYENITRAQVLTMVVRAAISQAGLAGVPAGWSDGVLPSGDPTHGANIRRAEYNGLTDGLEGLSGSWDPYAYATRGECAQVLYNLLPLLPPATDSPLDVLWVHADEEDPNNRDEFVVFRTLKTGSLGGYSVEDGEGHHYDFPDWDSPAGQVFKLHSGSGTNVPTDLYWGSASPIWNNGGEEVLVLDSEGHILESYIY